VLGTTVISIFPDEVGFMVALPAVVNPNFITVTAIQQSMDLGIVDRSIKGAVGAVVAGLKRDYRK
jgi:hypothetical protein